MCSRTAKTKVKDAEPTDRRPCEHQQTKPVAPQTCEQQRDRSDRDGYGNDLTKDVNHTVPGQRRSGSVHVPFGVGHWLLRVTGYLKGPATHKVAIVAAVRQMVLAAGLSAAVVASGCSGGNKHADTARIVRVGSPPAEIRDGKLIADPAPLTFAQVAKAGRTTPEGTVLNLYFWGQWGSIPNVVEMYDSRVRKAIGPITIADAYEDQRAALLRTKIRIEATVRTPLGITVTVEGFTKAAPPSEDSFLLVHRSGRWYVVHDTLLERGLAVVVGARASQGRSGEAAVRRGQRAGAIAARNYRNLALRLLNAAH